MTTAQTVEFRASAQFNPVFRPVNEWRGRYRILKGSAGSGKSVNIAQDYIAKLSDPAYQGANLVVVRKIEETNRDSTFAELQAAIYRMFGPYADRFWKVNLNPLALECKITGNRIIFRGVKDQRQREKKMCIRDRGKQAPRGRQGAPAGTPAPQAENGAVCPICGKPITKAEQDYSCLLYTSRCV